MKTHWYFSCRLCLMGMLLCSCVEARAQTAVEAWVRRYNSITSQDYARKVVTDRDGNVIVAGESNDGFTGIDILIIKYSGAGGPLWTNRHNGLGSSDDRLSDLAADHDGNVFITGNSAGMRATIAYSPAGVPLWTNYYTGPENNSGISTALAVDQNGNVFVTGYSYSIGSAMDYATIAYSGAGTALWTNRYNGMGSIEDYAYAVSVDQSGNVFVTGSSGEDYATIAYSGAGVPLWTNRYDGPGHTRDSAIAIAVDDTGNVFVTGNSSVPGAFYDPHYATIAYSPAGVPLWTNLYNGPGNFYDYAAALAVDRNGKVFVTGETYNPASSNRAYSGYATIAYSAAGVALWTNVYTGPGMSYSRPNSLALDNSGNVFVTGNSENDYATIKYSEAGIPLWTNRYTGPGISADVAYDVSVDLDGNIFVTGNSRTDYATIAYSGAGVALWTNLYTGPGIGYGRPSSLALGNSGNVFVTGVSDGSYATVAYSDAGVALWTNRYGSVSGSGRGTAVAVDGDGTVFVTGSSTGDGGSSDYATIAYSGAGIPLWTNRHNGPDEVNDYAEAIAVDGNGVVFVTGTSGNGSFSDYATIAYSAAGVALWTNRYNGTGNLDERAIAADVDRSGNVFVTGSSGGDYATLAYSSAGVPLWTNRYSGPNTFDQARAVAVDHHGNVFVTGYSADSDGVVVAFLTIAYSGAGVPLWTNRYYDGFKELASDLALDGNGNVFVTGVSRRPSSGANDYYTTIAYSGAGMMLWTNRYDAPGNGPDIWPAVAVGSSGTVFVTGTSRITGGNDDYVTIAYSGAGVPLWTNRYNGPASGPDQLGLGSPIVVARDGAVYVTGSSGARLGGLSVSDYATIKYVWQPQLAIQPLVVGSSTVNLNVSGPPNSSWAIERALMIPGPWTNLGLSLIGTNGSGSFRDVDPSDRGAFYRAIPP